jgi:hypothetical protein
MINIDLYLDLDGVILRRTGNTEFNGRIEFEVATGAMEFLSWAVDNFNCYWLTSRSHDGTYDEIERAFRLAGGSAEIKNLIRASLPAPWGAEKVSGIDLSRDFYYVDDNPDSGSVAALEAAGKASRLVIASTDQRPEDLTRVRHMLTRATHNQRDVAQLQAFMKEISSGEELSPEMAQWWWNRY